MSTALYAASDLSSIRGRNEPPMTLHVGMVGTDGIVLAGDTLQWANPLPDSIPSRAGISTWMNHTMSKIKISDDRKIAVACAGALKEAYPLADAIIAGLSLGSRQHPEGRIQEITQTFADSQSRWRGVQCLILFSEPQPALYLLECIPDELTGKAQSPQCCAAPMYAFAGDSLNGAIFWAMRYYRILPPAKQAICYLQRLSAQIVADAGALNTGSVGGLELVYCDQSGIHSLSARENYVLLREAQERSADILTRIIGD
jgi:hypothetical protein